MDAFAETMENQTAAASPARSAFVMANAGAGKTRVLTDRVARLLLAETPPEKILCITFTKAAAAEMAERLFDKLGGWALAEDDALRAALSALEGAAARQRSADDLAIVRRLFARALETPGGLKIQTIHAFCEQVLKRFPLEAGVAPGFAVLEDKEAEALRGAALDQTAMDAASAPALGAAFARLSAGYREEALRALLLKGAVNRLGGSAPSETGDAETAKALGVDPAWTADRLQTDFIDTLTREELERAYHALDASGGNPKKFGAAPLKAFLAERDRPRQWAALSALFLKKDGQPRARLTTKATDDVDPWASPYLQNAQQEFVKIHARLKALDLYLDTRAYQTLTRTLMAHYEAMKAARASLDFDDLIARTRDLLTKTDSAWVMYKLDQGVDHVLIDEAQDTSPAQWAIVEALLQEITSGQGARPASRSFFAVGDFKQSIYSFQGADADLFEEKEAALGKALSAAGAYENYDLKLSFRSTAPVLDFVDALFASPGAAQGLGQRGAPAHHLKRAGEAGLVALWPLAPRPEKPESLPWDAPVDAPAQADPIRLLSGKIAETIGDWIEKGEYLAAAGRPVRPGDIMILVQRRDALFSETIRALAMRGVAVAGADRLTLSEEPAIEDLMAFARAAIATHDDLSLAETLKSPLFRFDDDEDLFPLAFLREEGRSLWANLRARKDEHARWRRAAAEIAAARSIGLREGPYAFFSHILETGEPSGRQRFYERLSEASRDALDELLRQALDFESANPRSLQRFVQWFAVNAGDIKRELDRSGDAVRVMTVHGAKGLQSKIVFLLDAHRGPNLSKLGPLIAVDGHGDGARRCLLPILVNNKAKDIAASEEARAVMKEKAYEEYRRQLYVAATRAEDRLYICGMEVGRQKNPQDAPAAVKTWHALAEEAFDRLSESKTIKPQHDAPFWPDCDGVLRIYECPQTKAVKRETMAAPTQLTAAPSWLKAPARPERAKMSVAPSRLADEEEAVGDPLRGAPALSPVAASHYRDPYFRGRTLHRLLELTPDIAPAERRDAADRLLARLAPHLGVDERAEWRDEVLRVIHDPSFAPVFGPGARAEVAIAGAPPGERKGMIISGQIDRLAVFEDRVLAVDYKTNRPPPQTAEETAPAYLAQMAAYRALLRQIYPGREVKLALLWTFEARLMALPDALLDRAFAQTLAAG